MKISPPVLGFRREHRLLTPADFKQVFNNNCYRVGSRHFLLLAAKNGEPRQRLGFVIARKRVKRAVDRNLIKRLNRECFRQRPGQYQGLDIILLAKTPLLKPEHDSLRREITHLWDKLLAKYNEP